MEAWKAFYGTKQILSKRSILSGQKFPMILHWDFFYKTWYTVEWSTFTHQNLTYSVAHGYHMSGSIFK